MREEICTCRCQEGKTEESREGERWVEDQLREEEEEEEEIGYRLK